MSNTRPSFDEMPSVLATLLIEVRSMRVQIDSLSSKKPEEITPSQKLLSTNDVCRLLGKTKVTIYRMIKKGELVAYKKGKNLFFYEEEIREQLEAGRIKSDYELALAAQEFL